MPKITPFYAGIFIGICFGLIFAALSMIAPRCDANSPEITIGNMLVAGCQSR